LIAVVITYDKDPAVSVGIGRSRFHKGPGPREFVELDRSTSSVGIAIANRDIRHKGSSQSTSDTTNDSRSKSVDLMVKDMVLGIKKSLC